MGFHINQTSLNQKLYEVDQVSRARLLAAIQPEGGVWFPIPSIGTHLDDDTLRIDIVQWVSVPICHPHKSNCGGQVEY